jgi:galactokinase
MSLARSVEATAPCRLELIGGTIGPATRGPARLAIALDRRVFCWIEPIEGGVEIHSKDSLRRMAVPEQALILDATGTMGRVARALAAAGRRSGVRIATHEKVPADAGLGTGAALSVALAAALEPDLPEAEVMGRAGAAESALGESAAESDLRAAFFGGAHALVLEAGVASVKRLAADPARLEECLMLVDPGPAPARVQEIEADPAVAKDLVAALEAGSYEDVAGLLTALHRDRFAPASPEVRRIVEAVSAAGGAAWPCGRLLAVWAVPGPRAAGPREAVLAALKGAGARSFPARVDIRGLEMEEV